MAWSFLEADFFACRSDAWSASQKAQEEGSVDAFLKKDSKITFGYGKRHDGVDPIGFTIPNDQDVDVCFFKILVTTEAIDIGPITKSEISLSNVILRGAVQKPEPSDLEWASEIITVISKRAQPSEGLSNQPNYHLAEMCSLVFYLAILMATPSHETTST